MTIAGYIMLMVISFNLQEVSLPSSASAVIVIESVLSTCLPMCVCGSYVVFHFNRTELRCAPPMTFGATPTSDGHRSTMVHNAGRWCTTSSCTHEVVHNVGLTNPLWQVNSLGTKCGYILSSLKNVWTGNRYFKREYCWINSYNL